MFLAKPDAVPTLTAVPMIKTDLIVPTANDLNVSWIACDA